MMKLLAIFTAAVLASAATAPPVEYSAGVPASCSKLPADLELRNKTYVLPDPFRFLNGKKVKSVEDWHCRAAQIGELFQEYELGYKPPRPPILHATFENSSLSIVTGLSEDNTISFSVPITYSNVTGPYPAPAVVAYGGTTVPIPDGVATINFDIDEIAEQNNQSSRNVGLFYDLYGADGETTAGALMAWAWATSRIIDALEALPEAGIDPTKIAVTGCSRNGKGAMVAGAFDDRIALTIPQESGSGGDACWRTSRDMLVNQNLLTQAAQEIVGENVWFAEAFDFFGRDNYTVGLLPVDHHELAGLIAPRGLYSTSNVDFLWLGGWSCWECMKAANRIYEALGVPNNQGFSQDGGHNHCAFPDDQKPEVAAFFDRFLLGKDADTAVFRTVGDWVFRPRWVPWKTPTLV